jgi:serine O-acetyltransferase
MIERKIFDAYGMPMDVPDVDPMQHAIDHMLDDIDIMDRKMQAMCKALKKMGYQDDAGDLDSCQIRVKVKNETE